MPYMRFCTFLCMKVSLVRSEPLVLPVTPQGPPVDVRIVSLSIHCGLWRSHDVVVAFAAVAVAAAGCVLLLLSLALVAAVAVVAVPAHAAVS